MTSTQHSTVLVLRPGTDARPGPDPDPIVHPVADPARAEYWARVQELRADLSRLRPAN